MSGVSVNITNGTILNNPPQCELYSITDSHTSLANFLPMLIFYLILFFVQNYGRKIIHVNFACGCIIALLLCLQDFALLGMISTSVLPMYYSSAESSTRRLTQNLDWTLFMTRDLSAYGTEDQFTDSDLALNDMKAWFVLPILLIQQIFVTGVIKFTTDPVGTLVKSQEEADGVELAAEVLEQERQKREKQKQLELDDELSAPRVITARPLGKFARCCVTVDTAGDCAISSIISSCSGAFQCAPGTLFLLRLVLGSIKLIQSVINYCRVEKGSARNAIGEGQDFQRMLLRMDRKGNLRPPPIAFSTISLLGYVRMIMVGSLGLATLFLSENRGGSNFDSTESSSIGIVLVATFSAYVFLWFIFLIYGLFRLPKVESAGYLVNAGLRAAGPIHARAEYMRTSFEACCPVVLFWSALTLSDPTLDAAKTFRYSDGASGASELFFSTIAMFNTALVIYNGSGRNASDAAGESTKGANETLVSALALEVERLKAEKKAAESRSQFDDDGRGGVEIKGNTMRGKSSNKSRFSSTTGEITNDLQAALLASVAEGDHQEKAQESEEYRPPPSTGTNPPLSSAPHPVEADGNKSGEKNMENENESRQVTESSPAAFHRNPDGTDPRNYSPTTTSTSDGGGERGSPMMIKDGADVAQRKQEIEEGSKSLVALMGDEGEDAAGEEIQMDGGEGGGALQEEEEEEEEEEQQAKNVGDALSTDTSLLANQRTVPERSQHEAPPEERPPTDNNAPQHQTFVPTIEDSSVIHAAEMEARRGEE